MQPAATSPGRLRRSSHNGGATHVCRKDTIHGARAVLSRARTVDTPDRLRTWALALEKRSHHNKATVALANKIARIAWAVSVKQTDYRSVPAEQKIA